MTVKEFYDDHCWTEEGKEFGRAFCQSNVTADPSQVSLLWYAWYIACTGGTTLIWSTAEGAQQRKFVGGSMQISQKMASQLGDRIHLNQPVVKIVQRNDGTLITTLDGSKYKCKYVVLAIPPPLLQKIHYDPPMPAKKNQLIQRITMGLTFKCEIYYETPFWRKLGLSGFLTCADGIEVVGNAVDDCRPGSDMGQLTCFVYSDMALKFIDLTQEQRRDEIAKSLATIFGSEEASKPIHYVDHSWAQEQYTGGCYTTNFPPGILTKFGKSIREPHGTLFFAGTETATKWTGYMSGAIQAGRRAAKEILYKMNLVSKEEIWEEEQAEETKMKRPVLASLAGKIKFTTKMLIVVGMSTIMAAGGAWAATYTGLPDF